MLHLMSSLDTLAPACPQNPCPFGAKTKAKTCSRASAPGNLLPTRRSRQAASMEQLPLKDRSSHQQKAPSVLSFQLPAALQLHVLSLLPPNGRALTGRFICREAYNALKDDCTASLSQPLPPHAEPWAQAWAQKEGQEGMRRLPFQHKLQLLCTAAATGSEVNLEVARALLQPSVLPDYMQTCSSHPCNDPGVAAAKAGHPHLLGWLVRHCPVLLGPARVLQAAARCCTLAGLRAAWEALQGLPHISPHHLDQRVLDAAAGSATPDAVAKLEWVLATGAGACRLDRTTVAAAVQVGSLDTLRWLRDRGCPLGVEAVASALQHADLSVAQWLVDEAGCGLPPGSWNMLLMAAAQGSEGVAKLRWLQERGCPQLRGDTLLLHVALLAALAGQVEVLQSLLPLFGTWDVLRCEHLRPMFLDAAVRSGQPAVLECLQNADLQYAANAYIQAAGTANMAMIEWLARSSAVPPSTLRLSDLKKIIAGWPHIRVADSRGLLQAVQLLAGAGYSDWNIANSDAKRVVSVAAERGDLALVHYLLRRMPGLRLDGYVLTAAAKGGCTALVKWLAAKHPGCRAIPRDTSPYVYAARNADLGTLAVLRRLGVRWGSGHVVVRAVRKRCNMPGLRWLVEQGAPAGSRRDMERALIDAPERYGDEEQAWLRGLAVVPGAPAAGAGA